MFSRQVDRQNVSRVTQYQPRECLLIHERYCGPAAIPTGMNVSNAGTLNSEATLRATMLSGSKAEALNKISSIE